MGVAWGGILTRQGVWRMNGHGTVLESDFSENFAIHILCQTWLQLLLIDRSSNTHCLIYFCANSSVMYFVSATLYHVILTMTDYTQYHRYDFYL